MVLARAVGATEGAETAFVERAAFIVARFLLHCFNRHTFLCRERLVELSLSEWLELAVLRGVGPRPVSDDPGLEAFLIHHVRLGWRIYFNRLAPAPKVCRYLCHELAEHAQAACPELDLEPWCGWHGEIGDVRHRIAERVVELSFLGED